MSIANNSKVKLGQNIRNIVRSACTRAHGWDAWRAANLGDRASDQMSTLEIKQCAIALGIDIEMLASNAGVALTYFDARSSKVALPIANYPAGHAVRQRPVSMASLGAAIGLHDGDWAAGVPVFDDSAAVAVPVNAAAVANMADAAATVGNTPGIFATDDDSDDSDRDLSDECESDAAPMATLASAAGSPSPYEGRDVDMVLGETLATVSQLFGSTSPIVTTLSEAIRPLATIAVAPPRTIETVRHVHIAAPGATVAGGVRMCSIVASQSGRDALATLGIKPGDTGQWRSVLEQPVSVWDGTAAEGVPEIDPDHAWSAEALAYLTIAARHADTNDKLRNMSRVLFYGPAGTGKTSSVEQFAARTGRPYIRVAMDRGTEGADLLGQRMPKAGATEYFEGAMVAAMQIPGAVILCDEPSFLRPGIAAVLQTLLDKGAVYLKEDGNRRVEVAPGVIIVAADNTNLAGDETGRYADTMTQNMALSDRFAWMIAMDYMSKARETTVLHRKTGIPLAACESMVVYAGLTRNNAANGQLTSGLSLRRLVAWAIAVKAGIKSEQAFRAAVLNPADAADRETLRTLAMNSAPHATIDSIVHGLPLPGADAATMQAHTITPQGAAAANAFPPVV